MLKTPDVPTLTAAQIENFFEDDLIESLSIKIHGLVIQSKTLHIYSNIKPINVRIDLGDVEIAKRLGGGNVSAGLRLALKLVAASMKIENSKLGSPLVSGFMGGAKVEL